ncbi:MAG: chitosanase [Bauldia sp.]
MPDTAAPLNAAQKKLCEQILNVFETGSIRGNYGAISIFHDGPHGIRQVTYGRSQTTEYGNLRELVGMYADAGGRFSEDLRPYVPRIGRVALVDDQTFLDLLRRAGNTDPVMATTQDVFFDRRYFQPALQWAADNGFGLPLSILVIYDSFIHSGGILQLLRVRFPESPPARGGDEKTWIRQYTEARNNWLSTHSNPPVRASAYRTRDLLREIGRGNWDLSQLPILANGVPVGAPAVPAPHAAVGGIGGEDIPFLPEAAENAPAEGPVWSEAEPLEGATRASASPAAAPVGAAPPATAAIARRLIDEGRVEFAMEHVSGVSDDAFARLNIEDTAAGRSAHRSAYGNAPGGTVALDKRMLSAMAALSEKHRYFVTEIAGASHSPNSRHYAGIAFDVGILDGRPVNSSNPARQDFMAMGRALGASEVLGPGDPGHSTHIHLAWPRV